MCSANRVTVFGIRHHGPGSAHSLRRALVELRPDAILVEGPPDAQDLIAWVGHAELQPPVALLLYVPDAPRKAVYYPFAEFSPEWQALQFGRETGISVRFMDLPQAVQLAIRPGEDEAVSPDVAAAISRERIVDPLTWLAEAAGYSDGERWWERLVEQRRGESRELFVGILEMMSALRAEVERQPADDHPAFSAHALEAEREAYMRQTIRTAVQEGFQNIAVVCGAWHAPALAGCPDGEPAGQAKQDAERLKKLEKVKVAAAWAPWSYGRLSWRSGYGAGIESPGWYELLWQAARDELSPGEVTIRWLTQAAQLLRGEDLNASSAHVIEAVRLAEALAALRGQPLPGQPEFDEALRAVLCFGDDLPLRLIHEKLVVGERLGSVPADSPQTPLQADLAAQQKRLRLLPEAAIRDLDLDLRKPGDLERSYLLHRLALLEIPWGAFQPASGKSGTFHELWRLQWQPELAVKLIEASLWGNTIADAAAAFARHEAGETHSLPALTALIGQALLADLPDALTALMARLEAEAALASDVERLMDALPPIAEALRYGNVRQTDTGQIARVVDGLVARICIGLPAACASLDDVAASEMFTRLNGTQHVISLLKNTEYTEAWQKTLIGLADQNGLHGLLAGRCCAILMEAGILSAEEVSRRLGLALSAAVDPAQAAAWVEGLLRDSGAVLVHEDALWSVIDGWVSALPAERFTAVLPLVRRTFSTFTPPERRMLGERARQGVRPVAASSTAPADFDLQQAEAALPLLARLLGIGEEGTAQ